MFAKNLNYSLLVGLMLAIMVAPKTTAQGENQLAPGQNQRTGWDVDSRLDSPGSILHGRTDIVADWIKFGINFSNRRAAEQAGNPIPEDLTYNQITNLNQLASLETVPGLPYREDMHFSEYYVLTPVQDLRAGDLAGLVNLKAVGFNGLKAIEAGVFDGLPNLEVLHLIFSPRGDGGTLPADLFDPLANSLKDLRIAFGGSDAGTQAGFSLSLPANALNQLVNLEKLTITVPHEERYDHMVNLKEINFSYYFSYRGDVSHAYSILPRSTIILPPSVRTIGSNGRDLYKIQESVGSSPPPVNVGGGYVFPGVSPSPPPTEEVGQRSSDLRFTSTSLSLAEGESATYQVRATASRAGDMVVNLKTAHSGITVNPNRLTFYSHNWQTFQTVTVTAGANAADINEQASIMHSIPASPGFVAINDAGIVSVTLAHTVVEEEETQSERGIVKQLNVPPTDYDLDDNGLIEISNLEQLNAVRWDLNGDGQPDKETFANDYSLAFPSAIDNPQAQGYELTDDLDFGDNPTSWESIGVFSQPFQAVFEGNEHTIYNLFQDQSDPALFYNKPSGLFGAIGHRGLVVNLGMEGVQIKGVNFVGALAGFNQGSIGVCSGARQSGGRPRRWRSCWAKLRRHSPQHCGSGSPRR